MREVHITSLQCQRVEELIRKGYNLNLMKQLVLDVLRDGHSGLRPDEMLQRSLQLALSCLMDSHQVVRYFDPSHNDYTYYAIQKEEDDAELLETTPEHEGESLRATHC